MALTAIVGVVDEAFECATCERMKSTNTTPQITSKVTITLSFVFLGILPFSTASPRPDSADVLKDKDGNVYSSRRLSDGKRWMTQNLKTKTTGSHCYDDDEANCDRFGRLYTWEAAKQACQMLGDGWRLPTNDEWRDMAKQYGGVGDDSVNTGKSAFKALLESGNSGFNALLGGNRDSDGKYRRIDAHGFYLSSTEGDSGGVWFYNFAKGSQALYRHSDGDKSRACSVRCLKP